jgi:hypothetical protein
VRHAEPGLRRHEDRRQGRLVVLRHGASDARLRAELSDQDLLDALPLLQLEDDALQHAVAAGHDLRRRLTAGHRLFDGIEGEPHQGHDDDDRHQEPHPQAQPAAPGLSH